MSEANATWATRLDPVPLVDGHNDLAWAMRKLAAYDLDEVDLTRHVPALQTDLPRLRAGGVGAQFWSVFVPGTLQGDSAVTATLEQIDFVYALVSRHGSHLGLATSADEVDSVHASGRVASLLGIEGGHSINESLGTLRMMRALGVRYMTLTHNENLPWADSGTDEPVLGGLSPFGEDVVREMNRIGMLVDLSHVSADVMRQAFKVSGAPVIFSHSSARAVCDVPRNVPDDVLAELPANGGVCMVTFVPMFVSPSYATWINECQEVVEQQGGNPKDVEQVDAVMSERQKSGPCPEATVDDVVAHLEHVRDVAGIDHVGIGGDYDGSRFMPIGLEDVSGYPRLFDALAVRGWSDADLRKLAGANILRVLRAADELTAPGVAAPV
jgi:membrane dipeptidase